MNHTFAIISFSGFLLTGSIAIFVFMRNPRERLNRLFLGFCLLVALNQMFNFLSIIGRDPFSADRAYQLSNVAWLFFLTVFLHFCLVFAKKDTYLKVRVIMPTIYFFTLIMSGAAVGTHWFYVVPRMTEWGYFAGLGEHYYIFVLHSLVFLLLSTGLLWSIWREGGSRRERGQGRILFFSMILSFVFGFTAEGVLPLFGLVFPTVTPISSTSFVVFFGYAMMRYGYLRVTPSVLAQKIIETMPDFLIFNDPQDRIKLVNQNYLRVFGYEANQVLDRKLADLKEDDRSGEPTEGTASLEPGGWVAEREMFLLAKSGAKVPVVMTASLVKDRFGDKNGCLHVFRDLSVEKKLLAEQRRMIGELTAAKIKMTDLLGAADQQLRKTNQVNAELEDFHRKAVDRELRMIELEGEIKRLKAGA